jgi:hypothetical protein
LACIRCCHGFNLTKLAVSHDQAHEFLHGGNVLIRIFLVGILLGITAAAGALYALPAVDQQREVSLITVTPNGGNRESFHINIPFDRIMVGTAGEKGGLPVGMNWPLDEVLAGIRAELFKVRNERDTVIGVAARTVAKEDDSDVIDWVIHLPARGTFFVNMESAAPEGEHRIGEIRTGTRELAKLRGFVAERWVPDTSGDEDAPAGRIELLLTYSSIAEHQE